MYEWVYLSKWYRFARRDKYEKDLKEYWIDTHTEGNFENEREESIIDATIGEGDPTSLELGIQGPDSLALEGQELQQEGEDTDQEVDVDDGGASSRSKPRTNPDCEKESAFEAQQWIWHCECKVKVLKLHTLNPDSFPKTDLWAPGCWQRVQCYGQSPEDAGKNGYPCLETWGYLWSGSC